MSKHWLVIIGITLLTGCASGLQVVKYVGTGGGKSPCKDYHPVMASFSGCQVPNFGITDENVNDKAHDGRCFAFGAIEMGKFEMFDTLLRHGISLEECKWWQRGRIFVDRQRTEEIPKEFWRSWIHGRGCDDLRFPERFKALGFEAMNAQEMLFYALNRHCLSATRMALELGADPNKANQEGSLPLHKVGLGETDFAELLIDSGADPFLVVPGRLSPYEQRKQLSSEDFKEDWLKLEAVFNRAKKAPAPTQ